jgi:hypothetical protein
MLDKTTLQSLADTYFCCCHQQPYSYFHEGTFRQNLETGALPNYLVLAVAATAVRFSNETCFSGRETEAMDCYAKTAWSEIIEQSFSDGHELEIYTVQAASLLGILDYVGMLATFDAYFVGTC